MKLKELKARLMAETEAALKAAGRRFPSFP